MQRPTINRPKRKTKARTKKWDFTIENEAKEGYGKHTVLSSGLAFDDAYEEQ